MPDHRYRCGHSGCDFGADSLDEMAVHGVLAHDFEEVPADELPPLPAAITFPPLAELERSIGQRGTGKLTCFCRRPIVIDPGQPTAWERERCSGCGSPAQQCGCAPLCPEVLHG